MTLNKRERQFSLFMDHFPGATCVKDKEGTILYCNEQFAAKWKKTKDELIGKRDNDFLPPDIASFARNQDQEVLNTLTISEGVQSFMKNDSLYHALIRKFPIKLSEEELLLGFFSIDITEGKKAELELQASKQQFDMFMEQFHGAAWIKDEQNKLIYCNSLYASMVGKEPEELIGKNSTEYTPTELADAFAEENRQVLDAGYPLDFEHVFPGPEGPTYWLTRKFPLLGKDGTKYLGSISLDSTERVKAKMALEKREQQFRSLAESSPMGIFQNDAEGNCIYVNPQCAKLVGMTVEECLGYNWTPAVHPEDRERVIFDWMDAIKNKRQLYNEGRWLHKDGTIVSTLGIAVPLIDPDGELTGYIGSLVDITEKRLAEEVLAKHREELEKLVEERTFQLNARINEIEQLNQQLQSANEDLESFSFSVSHDLRAPLRHINGFTSMVKKKAGDRLDPTSVQYLDQTITAAHRMKQLIDDLLAFSRTNRKEMQTGSVNMNNIVNDVRNELALDLENRKISWKLHEFPLVEGDTNLLKIVWRNLLNNAIKYTGPRDQAFIELGYQDEQEEHIFFVKDNGVGFESQFAHKLFGVFQRLHRRDEFEGSGIGLATVQRIIIRHGGRVWAEGEVEKGARIYFTLPKHSSLHTDNNYLANNE